MNAWWVKVEDRLPEYDHTVLIAMTDGEIWTGYLDAGEWRYVSGDPLNGDEITHWMHLPPHPRELSGNSG